MRGGRIGDNMNNKTKRAIRLIVALTAGVAVFFGVLLLLNTQAYSGMIGLLGPGVLSSSMPMMLVSLLFAVFAAALVYQTLNNRVYLAFTRVAFGVYLAGLLFAILGKSVGIRGINLNLADVVATVQVYPGMLLLNIALFVPLGWYLCRRFGSIARAALVALAVSFVLEVLQYVFELGLTDIVDVCANTLGGCMGGLAWACAEPFLNVESDERYGQCYAFSVPQAAGRRTKRSAVGLGAVVVALTAFCSLAAAASPPVDQSSNNQILVDENADPALVALAQELDTGTDLSASTPLAVSGVLVQDERWETEGGITFTTLVVVSEQPDATVPSVRVGTSYPIMVGPSATLSFGGEQVDEDGLYKAFMDGGMLSVSCELVPYGGCFVATKVDAAPCENPDPDAPLAYFNFNIYSDLYLGDIECPTFMTWSDDQKRVELRGYVGSTMEAEDLEYYATICGLDEVNGVPVLHAVNASYDLPPSEDGEPNDPETYRAVLGDDGALHLVGE